VTGFLRPILLIAWKDILLEVRTKEIITSMLIFALLVVIIFNFAFDPSPALVVLVVPGIFWVAFTFAGVLGFNRSFILEKDRGSLDGLLLCPVSRDVIYLGKLVGTVSFMVVAEVLLLPVFAVLYNVSLFLPGFLLVAFLATLGFAIIGTLFSAMAVNTRSREIMLPLLLFPISVPVLIAAVEATRALLDPSVSMPSSWWQLLLAFDVIFLVISSFLFGTVLEE
jgi:heme exporter protein B